MGRRRRVQGRRREDRARGEGRPEQLPVQEAQPCHRPVHGRQHDHAPLAVGGRGREDRSARTVPPDAPRESEGGRRRGRR